MSEPVIRPVAEIRQGVPATDGAGVKLTRIIGTPSLTQYDPFLLLDEFRSENKQDYIAGFPSHPHRGFETVTYMKHGRFRHKDSIGNEGLLTSGAIQWMTAGKGIIHSEMPEVEDGLVWGYQLWLNLPAKDKMIEPRYQDIQPDQIPVIEEEGRWVKVMAGNYNGQEGASETRIPVIYFDVELKAGIDFSQPMPVDMNGFIYLYEGSAQVGPPDHGAAASKGDLVLLGDGDLLTLTAGDAGAGMLVIAGQRLNEPIVRGGPFVMSTEGELRQAFLDYQNGVLVS